jgi:large subunit ribosomal protein L22
MTGVKTNERPGTRAKVRFVRMSASKAREVLDLIRGLPVDQADETLELVDREAAVPVRKLLASAIANAENNDELDGDDLFISACYADEGPTLKRWRPRARGRATRIRKRTCHMTLIVSPMPQEMRAKLEADRDAGTAATGAARRRQEARAARVRKSQAKAAEAEGEELDEDLLDEEAAEAETETETDEAVEDVQDDVSDEAEDLDEETETAEAEEPEDADDAAEEEDK